MPGEAELLKMMTRSEDDTVGPSRERQSVTLSLLNNS
jgi:hypothetical protein